MNATRMACGCLLEEVRGGDLVVHEDPESPCTAPRVVLALDRASDLSAAREIFEKQTRFDISRFIADKAVRPGIRGELERKLRRELLGLDRVVERAA